MLRLFGFRHFSRNTVTYGAMDLILFSSQHDTSTSSDSMIRSFFSFVYFCIIIVFSNDMKVNMNWIFYLIGKIKNASVFF